MLSSEVEELVMHFVVTCDDKYSMTAAKSVTHGEVKGIDVLHS